MSVALTADQTAFFRQKLGTSVDLTDTEARLIRLLGDQFKVVVEVLEERISEFAANPTSFSVDGYSQNTGTNLTELRKMLLEAQSDLNAGEDLAPAAVRIVAPAAQASRSVDRFSGFSTFGRW